VSGDTLRGVVTGRGTDHEDPASEPSESDELSTARREGVGGWWKAELSGGDERIEDKGISEGVGAAGQLLLLP
jgi:hypothetical protein